MPAAVPTVSPWPQFLAALIARTGVHPFDPRYPLIPELIPSTSWFENARQHFAGDWGRLKRDCYQQAGRRCEICHGRGPEHPVEAHEVWAYDENRRVQTLERLWALCPACHRVKHAGLWGVVRQRWDLVVPHLQAVNGIEQDEAHALLHAHFQIHERRSSHPWVTDMSVLQTMGVSAPTFVFGN